MLNPNPVASLFLSIALSTWASVISLPASIHLTDPGLAVANDSLSVNADTPDPRFSISPRFSTALLPIDPCLMSVLYFMSEIAYGDFTQWHPPKTYRVPGYDEVEITTGAATTARFLIWGIWLAMEFMISNSRFHDVTWTLRWKDRILGTISIQTSAPPPTLPPPITNIHPSPLPSPANNPPTPNTTPLSAPHTPNTSLNTSFSVTISSFADSKPLTHSELFMACYTGLLHCAQQPTTALMQSFGNRSPIGGVSLHLFRYGPSLSYAYIIRALSHIPRYLLQDPRGFREVNFDLWLDGVLCARGAVTKGRV